MKTGYTEASGHNLVTSATHSGVRLIGVVLGRSSNPERDAHMATLLDQGFEQLDVPTERRTTVANRSAQPGQLSARRSPCRPIGPPAPYIQAAPPQAYLGDPGRQLASEGGARAAALPRPACRRQRRGTASNPASLRSRTIWRAQVIGLTACRGAGRLYALSRHRTPCIRPASRSAAGGKPLTGAAQSGRLVSCWTLVSSATNARWPCR